MLLLYLFRDIPSFDRTYERMLVDGSPCNVVEAAYSVVK
jgi:hypothetical protein